MKKVEHIGIAVSNLDIANELYTEILGTNPYKTEIIDLEDVKTSFFQAGETKIELLQGIGKNNAISNFFSSGQSTRISGV